MPRIRTIKPEFFRSRTIHALTLEQQLTFIGLWTRSDDQGRSEYDPKLIKADVWPLSDRTDADIAEDLRALSESSLITHYTVGEGSYVAVNGWAEHQKINRPTPSRIPPPEDGEIAPVPCENESECGGSVTTHGGLTEGSLRARKEQGTGNREQGITSSGHERPDVEEVCTHLQQRIAHNGAKATVTAKWRTEARLLLDRDGRDLGEALELIEWCQTDSFWRSNILSMPKFREKYDQLKLKSQQPTNGTPAERVDSKTGFVVETEW